jgi:hypothetical protein
MKLMQNVSVAVARKSARTVALRHTTRIASADIVDERCRGWRRRNRLALPDLSQQQRRHDEGESIRRDGDRRGQPRDERAAQGRARDLRDGVDGLALAVGVEQALRRHQIGDEHVVGEVVEHRRHSGDDGDCEQQRQRDVTEDCGERNGEKRGRAHEIGADHERPAAAAVDDAASDPCEDGSGKGQRDGEEAEIDGAGARGDDRGDGQRGAGDTRTDGRDTLRAPQKQKVAVPPQSAARQWQRHAAPSATANRSP